MKIYAFTDKTIEKILADWPIYRKAATDWTNLVIERTKLIETAISEKIPLSNPNKVLIGNVFFTEVRKALNLYTHKFKKTIEEKESNPTFSPMKEENFNRMKEVQLEANKWYKSFNKVVSDYKSQEQIYKILFLNHTYKMDFEDLLKK